MKPPSYRFAALFVRTLSILGQPFTFRLGHVGKHCPEGRILGAAGSTETHGYQASWLFSLSFIVAFIASFRQDMAADTFFAGSQGSGLAGPPSHMHKYIHPFSAGRTLHLRKSGGVLSFMASVQQQGAASSPFSSSYHRASPFVKPKKHGGAFTPPWPACQKEPRVSFCVSRK